MATRLLGFWREGHRGAMGSTKKAEVALGKPQRLTGTEASALYESLMGNAILLGFGLGRPGFKV